MIQYIKNKKALLLYALKREEQKLNVKLTTLLNRLQTFSRLTFAYSILYLSV